MVRIWKVLTRKKAIDPVTAEETRLGRVLNVFDLTALGIGSTLGVGIYVLAGQVAKATAGPAVILSFLIAAIASVFAGLCYAEFGARAPRAGSAYIYSYVCVGEFIAFVIGWNLILEYVIGSASVARGLSLYLDTLINDTLQNTFREIAPINVHYFSSYFDFFSFGISIILAIGLAFGLKESSMANNIMTSFNIIVVLFIIIAGSLKADLANWNITPNSTTNTTNIGKGGFFPFGFDGVMKGAATCFYGFVGFDCIATTGEEVKNPRKAIPISIIVSLLVVFLAYFGVSTVLTLMVPYYAQDYNAPIPKAFETVGWEVAKWIVAIGAMFGLCASLFGAMFPLPRIIYAMGSDGLVFKFLAKVHPKFQTPVVGTLLAGVLTGLMSALFELSQLVNMMSIGTLQAYTIVAASVLLLRYKEEVKKVYIPIKTSSDTESVSSESSVDEKYNDDGIRQNFDGPSTSDEQELLNTNSSSFSRSLRYIINCTVKEPNRITENIVAIEVFIYCILCGGIGVCYIYLKTYIVNGESWAIAITAVLVILAIFVMISLSTQPKSRKELSFKVPLLPLIPALSILVNIYLMLMLDYMTWIRFAVWMAVGIPMYGLCACTDKTPTVYQTNGNYTTNLTNGHTKMSNGLSNSAFLHNETNGLTATKQKTSRKKAAAPPPPYQEQKETIEVQQEAAIAQLDEILEKEVAIAQLDDVLNNETIRINDRKLSAGTLSNMSAVISHSENVVADVHCADVITPVAYPQSIPFPTVSVISLSEPNIDNELNAQIDNAPKNAVESVQEEKSKKDINSNEVDQPNSEAPEIDSKNNISSNIVNQSNNELQEQGSSIHSGISDITSDKPETQIPNEPIKISFDSVALKIQEPSMEHVNQMSDDLPEDTDQKPKPLVTIDPMETKKALDYEPVISSPVPNEDALKTVTLRHVKKQIKRFEPTNNQSASDDNLRVGSVEYKNFIQDLNDKLKRNTVVPTYYRAPKKDVVFQLKPVKPNENVIEDNIDQVNAKEKLKQFYAARNADEHAANPAQPEHKQPTLFQSKSVDENVLPSNSASLKLDNLKPAKEKSSKLANSELDDHKSKMQNVFNSINLKRLETQGQDRLKRRLSRSLGSSFSKSDDESNHKTKMDDIFKSINAMRKDSFKKEKNIKESE